MILFKKFFTIKASLVPAESSPVDLKDYIFKGTVSVLLLYLLSIVFGFVLNYLLIRSAGTADYGTYVYALNLITLIAGFAVMGTDNLLVKNLAVYKDQANNSLFKGLLLFAIGFTLLFSLLAGLVSIFAFDSMSALNALNWYDLVFLFFIILPLTSVIIVLQSSFQGLSKPFLSQFADKLLRPLLFIAIITIFFILGRYLSASELVMINSGVLLVTVLVLIAVHHKVVLKTLAPIGVQLKTIPWLRISFSFFLLDVLYNINSRVDIFLIGLLRNDPTEVAACNIVIKLSELVGIGLFLVNMLLAPLVSKYIVKNEISKLQEAVTYTARLALVISLPLFIFILIFGNKVLALFDVASAVSFRSLMILSFAQLINVFMGSVGVILSMSGHQRYSIYTLAISIVLNIVLDIILIPPMGLMGVAIASGASLILWNFLIYMIVRKKTNLKTTGLKFI
ncbi:MAG: hypothetical protein E6H07_18720 [Bacteroidetes bacterium]|nr:MAG: hypothetical protein E6H07_18720 [Bacteroidota bacterium]